MKIKRANVQKSEGRRLEGKNLGQGWSAAGCLRTPSLIKHVVVIVIVVVVVRLHKVLDFLLGPARSLSGPTFGCAQAAAVLVLFI